MSTKEQLSCFCPKCKKEIIVKITTMKKGGVVINIVACPQCDRLLNDELVKKYRTDTSKGSFDFLLDEGGDIYEKEK